MPTFNTLLPGDPFPWIKQRTATHPSFAVETMAGRYIVLCFFGSLADPIGQGAIAAARRRGQMFDDSRGCFFGVSVDPNDEAQGRVCDGTRGFRILWDFDAAASRSCGIVPNEDDGTDSYRQFRRSWIIVDPTLHVLAIFSFKNAGVDHERVFDFLDRLPAPREYGGLEIPAPILVLPNVLEPELCQHLIDLYEADGGNETGVMRNNGGVLDGSFKRRRDYTVTDAQLCGTLRHRIARRVIPEIRKLFFMEITRMERYIVGCYAAEDGGHFRPHRDNGPGVTEHRRFAVSINLNGGFEGGEVRFPEYNQRGIKGPPGWAVIFPAAILHAVSRVTSGRRYAFLPFIYDELGARIRQRNLRNDPAVTANPAPTAAVI